jgi:TM2 domain-containing membrane protein YozV
MSRHDDDDDDDFEDDDRPSRRGRRDRDRDDDDDDDDRDNDVGDSKRMVAGLCAIFAGSFGVHKFILGYTLEGTLLLSMTLVGILIGTAGAFGGAICCFPFVLMVFYLAPIASGVIALIEGIIYLTKTDEEFIETYQVGRRTWF